MRGRTATARTSLLLAALVCLCAADARARQADAGQDSPLTDSPEHLAGTTRKIDEYGKVGHCDESARLDNFAIELQNEPSAKGYLVVYVGRNDLPSWAEGIKQRAAWYLVNSRGLNAERVKVIDGGHSHDPGVELWVVPPGAQAPTPRPEQKRNFGFYSAPGEE